MRVPTGLAAAVGGLVCRILVRTCRLRFDPESKARLAQLPEPAILACWHEQALSCMPFVIRLVRSGRAIVVMASHSRDGELTARLVGGLGVVVVRGSTSRGGRAGLRALFRAVHTQGCSPLMLPDGPRGPARLAKPGIVVLAQMSGAPIVPLAFSPRRAWTLRSWDRMSFPYPFTTIRVTVGAPFAVPRELSDAERDRLVQETTATIERACGREPGT